MSVKLKIARAQLGTALDLFIRDMDPLSVQALACGGSEIMEGIAEQASLPTLTTHILTTNPGLDRAKVKRLRNQYWNAIKHFYAHDNKTARDDEALMTAFTDRSNDAVLFMGWLDYMAVVKRLPIEVQVFQVWWYATDEKRLALDADPTPMRNQFPDIATDNRHERKRRLCEAIEEYRDNPEILAHPATEREPLVLPNTN